MIIAVVVRVGVTGWSAAHRTDDFHLGKAEIARALAVMAAVWSHETVEAPITDGVDEIALALRADAWQRSYRTRVVTTRMGLTPVRSRHGLTLLPDDVARPGRYVIPGGDRPAVTQLDEALMAMGKRYGPFAVRMARLGMEYSPGGRPAG